jgi:hypothetical protein
MFQATYSVLYGRPMLPLRHLTSGLCPCHGPTGTEEPRVTMTSGARGPVAPRVQIAIECEIKADTKPLTAEADILSSSCRGFVSDLYFLLS